MEKNKNISMAVIKRLPKYYRYLEELMKNAGYEQITVKKDLAGLDRVVIGKKNQEEKILC